MCLTYIASEKREESWVNLTTKTMIPIENSKNAKLKHKTAIRKVWLQSGDGLLRMVNLSDHSHPSGVVNRLTSQQMCNQKERQIFKILQKKFFIYTRDQYLG